MTRPGDPDAPDRHAFGASSTTPGHPGACQPCWTAGRIPRADERRHGHDRGRSDALGYAGAGRLARTRSVVDRTDTGRADGHDGLVRLPSTTATRTCRSSTAASSEVRPPEGGAASTTPGSYPTGSFEAQLVEELFCSLDRRSSLCTARRTRCSGTCAPAANTTVRMRADNARPGHASRARCIWNGRSCSTGDATSSPRRVSAALNSRGITPESEIKLLLTGRWTLGGSPCWL